MRRRTIRKTSLLVPTLLLSIVTAVSAAPVDWTILDLRFDDGAAAFGHYTYDDATNVITAWDINVVPALNPSTHINHYEPSSGDATVNIDIEMLFIDYIELTELHIILSRKMTSAGGFRNTQHACEFRPFPYVERREQARSGFVSGTAAVPVPSTLILLGTGLIGLGWCRTKRRKK